MARWVWVLAAGMGCSGEGVELDGADTDAMTTDCTGADVFTAGMGSTSTLGSTVKITQATPTPPDVGDNTWTLEVQDPLGAPAEGLSIHLRPWMPLHGHGLTPATYAATDLGGGAYMLETFDLIMPGTWEFTVDLGGEEEDTALFVLCAEG